MKLSKSFVKDEKLKEAIKNKNYNEVSDEICE